MKLRCFLLELECNNQHNGTVRPEYKNSAPLQAQVTLRVPQNCDTTEKIAPACKLEMRKITNIHRFAQLKLTPAHCESTAQPPVSCSSQATVT